MVLERYSDAIIDYATNPVTGIQRVSKWPPSIAEVVSHCDAEVERLAKIKRYREMTPQPHVSHPMQHKANVFVPASNIKYKAMAERALTGSEMEYRHDEQRGGIWVALGWLEEERRKPQGFKQFTVDDLRALYARKDEAAA